MKRFPPTSALLPVLALLSFLFYQCSSTTQPGITVSDQPFSQQIRPAFAALDIPSDVFEIKAGMESVIRTKTGTRITIPANALVDENGKQVTGKVAISYREFHDAADIILSGLPMAYDSAGQIYQFQTAGMMEIQAEQKGKPVYIQEGKAVEVSMASFVNEPNYNLYFLEPENNTWEYLGRPELGVNEEKREAEEALNAEPMPEKPTLPKEGDETKGVFAFEVDYSQFPELAGFEGIQWEFAGKDPAKDPRNNPEALATVWNQMDLSPAGRKDIYTLTLRSPKQSFSTEVRPVLDGKNRRKARKKLKKALAEYEIYLEQRRKKEEQIAMKANLARTFFLSDFGVYNCDRYSRRPQVASIQTEFEFQGIESGDPLPETVFLVTADARSVVQYSTRPGSLLTFDPSESNLLVAVTGKDQIAVFSAREFREANLRTRKNYTFYMRPHPQQIKGATDLRLAMGI